MIRRDDGSDWLLIPQIEHAHLAADIATAWGNNNVSAMCCSPELLSAIRHHDDGWQAWDLTPRIDRETGRPRSFTEMPMSLATELWTTSIQTCHKMSPLGGICVSKHFCWLAEKTRESRLDEPDERDTLDEFLNTQRKLQHAWRRDVLSADPTEDELNERIENGFLAIQFFDRISLWICCAVRTERMKIECPGFGPIRFSPREDDHIAVKPFPFDTEHLSQTGQRLKLTVSARRIPAREYADDADLQKTLSTAENVQLSWTLIES